jgi:hypothetical protein
MRFLFQIILTFYAFAVFFFGIIISDKSPTAGAIGMMTCGACLIALFLGSKHKSE